MEGAPNYDFIRPDAGLRPVVGVQSYQVLRASRNFPQYAEGYGWTYNHHPMLTYWNNAYHVLFNSSPLSEECSRAHVLLSTSRNGRDWSFPSVVFPSVWHRNGYTLANHRMGFFIAADGRLLLTTAYFPPDQRVAAGTNEDTERVYYGVVVREAYRDGTFGPIYFIATNRSRYADADLPFPLYTASDDAGFVAACEELRRDKLITLHWWEQLRPENFPFPRSLTAFAEQQGDRKFLKAISYYRRADGALVGLSKMSWAMLSYDDGNTWTTPVQLTTVSGGYSKVWGQRTSDGRYALLYDPRAPGGRFPPGKMGRYPMACATSDDGVVFRDVLVVNPEVYRRYDGHVKDPGPCNYQRGVYEGARVQLPNPDMWVTYSMSKEDIWVSRIPVPITGVVREDVDDTFDHLAEDGPVTGWNIYSPAWAPVGIAAFPSDRNKSLRLADADPHDYAKAVRVFPESGKVTISFALLARQNRGGRLEIEVESAAGPRPVRLQWTGDGRVLADTWGEVIPLGFYEADRWQQVELEVDCVNNRFSVVINGTLRGRNLQFNASGAVATVERLVFRTGVYRGVSFDPVNPDVDKPLDRADVFHLDNVRIRRVAAR